MKNSMTPKQKLQWAVLAKNAEWKNMPMPEYPCENTDKLYSELMDADEHYDPESEIRCSGIETNIDAEYSRHYESKSVAMKFPDNSWVGWTYWYGGGKHARPEEIDWMSDAYDLNCQEEEQTVIVKTFSKIGQ